MAASARTAKTLPSQWLRDGSVRGDAAVDGVGVVGGGDSMGEGL
jgi:hypothetical protein